MCGSSQSDEAEPARDAEHATQGCHLDHLTRRTVLHRVRMVDRNARSGDNVWQWLFGAGEERLSQFAEEVIGIPGSARR